MPDTVLDVSNSKIKNTVLWSRGPVQRVQTMGIPYDMHYASGLQEAAGPGQPTDFESKGRIQFLHLVNFSRVHSTSKMYDSRFYVILDKVFKSYTDSATVPL